MEFKHVREFRGSGQGYILDTTRAAIEKVFGKPTFDEAVEDFSGDGKITVEWSLQFADGTYASIYDYKRYELGTPEMNEEYDWHIGGNSFRAVELVAQALGVSPKSRDDMLRRAGLM